MAGIDARRASLTKKRVRDGWEWLGQIRYKDEAGRWRTIQRVLTDGEGRPIPTDADEIGEDGERVRTNRNVRRAQRALDELCRSLDGSPMGGRSPVADYVASDIEGRRGTIQDSTLRKYREYVPIIAAGFPGVEMRDLDVPRVRAWVRSMRDRGLARSTVRTAYAILHKTCERAVESGDLRSNPCIRGIVSEDGPRRARDEGRPNALDADGVRRANAMLDSCANDRLRIGARLALVCGLRAQEACGLRWRDVCGESVTVSESIGRADSGTYAKEPKTGESERTVPLPRPVAAELDAWRDAQLAEWQIIADGQEGHVTPFSDCRVIGYMDGSHMTPHALGNAWTRLARSGDADGPLMGTRGRVCTFHDLRHTFATHAIAEGADVRSVASLMGHADPTVTLRAYADATDEGRARAMDRAASALTSGTSWAGERGDGETEPLRIVPGMTAEQVRRIVASGRPFVVCDG